MKSLKEIESLTKYAMGGYKYADELFKIHRQEIVELHERHRRAVDELETRVDMYQEAYHDARKEADTFRNKVDTFREKAVTLDRLASRMVLNVLLKDAAFAPAYYSIIFNSRNPDGSNPLKDQLLNAVIEIINKYLQHGGGYNAYRCREDAMSAIERRDEEILECVRTIIHRHL